MSFIIAQQAKLDLELVPNEKRLEIGKCNRRLNPGKIQREPTFQVILDALALTPCYSAFLITADVPEGQDFDALPTDEEIICINIGELLMLLLTKVYLERQLEDFIYQIDNRAYRKQEKIYYPRFTKVLIHYFLTQYKAVSWRNKIGMHTSRDDYLINTLRFVSTKEATQIYGAIHPESLTSPAIKETKAYKTYLGFATGATPPKKDQKFKKPASPQLT
ncbi:hypothetical protein Tco_0789105 [Tanacetum coccineum]